MSRIALRDEETVQGGCIALGSSQSTPRKLAFYGLKLTGWCLTRLDDVEEEGNGRHANVCEERGEKRNDLIQHTTYYDHLD